MGFFYHKMVVVWGYDKDRINDASKIALDLEAEMPPPGGLTTEPVPMANGLWLFTILPTGGKSGGSIEARGELLRSIVLREYDKRGINYVVLGFGEDVPRILAETKYEDRRE